MEELKNKLLQAASEAKLPLEAIYYVSKDFFRDVEATYQNYLKQVEAAKNAEALQQMVSECEIEKIEEVEE